MKTLFAIVLLAMSISWAECPNGPTGSNTLAIDPNSVGYDKMPYDITLDFNNPHLSFFRINWWGASQCFMFDISTDKGKQIYAMLLASKAQCRFLTIYTGDYINPPPALEIEIKKLVLE